MKRLMSITLAVVLVLALGSWAFANELKGDLEAEIPVRAEIGPYAEVTGTRNIEFGLLDGEVGIYVVNGDWFYNWVLPIFDADQGRKENDNPDGWGQFVVESNTDITIAVSFDSDGWMKSPTVFGVHRGGSEGDGWWNVEVYNAWAGHNVNLGNRPTSFVHYYDEDGLTPGPRKYDVNGAIWIQSISQQAAQAYEGTLVVTVSK